MNRKKLGIIVGIIIIVIIGFMLYVISAQHQTERKMLEGMVSCPEGLVPQECGWACGRDSLQMCIDNLNREKNRTASGIPDESVLGWWEENVVHNEEFIQNPTAEKCEWVDKQIMAIQEAADGLPEGDANAAIYLKGVAMYEESRQKYC